MDEFVTQIVNFMNIEVPMSNPFTLGATVDAVYPLVLQYKAWHQPITQDNLKKLAALHRAQTSMILYLKSVALKSSNARLHLENISKMLPAVDNPDVCQSTVLFDLIQLNEEFELNAGGTELLTLRVDKKTRNTVTLQSAAVTFQLTKESDGKITATLLGMKHAESNLYRHVFTCAAMYFGATTMVAKETGIGAMLDFAFGYTHNSFLSSDFQFTPYVLVVEGTGVNRKQVRKPFAYEEQVKALFAEPLSFFLDLYYALFEGFKVLNPGIELSPDVEEFDRHTLYSRKVSLQVFMGYADKRRRLILYKFLTKLKELVLDLRTAPTLSTELKSFMDRFYYFLRGHNHLVSTHVSCKYCLTNIPAAPPAPVTHIPLPQFCADISKLTFANLTATEWLQFEFQGRTFALQTTELSPSSKQLSLFVPLNRAGNEHVTLYMRFTQNQALESTYSTVVQSDMLTEDTQKLLSESESMFRQLFVCVSKFLFVSRMTAQESNSNAVFLNILGKRQELFTDIVFRFRFPPEANVSTAVNALLDTPLHEFYKAVGQTSAFQSLNLRDPVNALLLNVEPGLPQADVMRSLFLRAVWLIANNHSSIVDNQATRLVKEIMTFYNQVQSVNMMCPSCD